MRRIESIDDQMNGVVTYELTGGVRVCLEEKAVREYGAADLLEFSGYGHLLPTERTPVMQSGRKIGTVPPDFDPFAVKSRSFFYEPRRGDFRREGDVWIADRMIGPGDFEAIPGFVWERESKAP